MMAAKTRLDAYLTATLILMSITLVAGFVALVVMFIIEFGYGWPALAGFSAGVIIALMAELIYTRRGGRGR